NPGRAQIEEQQELIRAFDVKIQRHCCGLDRLAGVKHVNLPSMQNLTHRIRRVQGTYSEAGVFGRESPEWVGGVLISGGSTDKGAERLDVGFVVCWSYVRG